MSSSFLLPSISAYKLSQSQPFYSNKSETVFRSCKKYFKRKILRQQFLYDILITFIITFLPIFPKYLKRVMFFKSIVHIRDFLLSVL